MSCFEVFNGELISFHDFCLSEAITNTPTKFGSNIEADDNKISTRMTDQGPTHHAFFHHVSNNTTGHHAVGVLQSGEAILGTHDKPSNNIFDYNDQQRYTRSNPIGAFGKSMHVIDHIAKEKNIKNIKFRSAGDKLGSLYKTMVNNKHFHKSMNDSGWNYSGEHDGFHHFDRK